MRGGRALLLMLLLLLMLRGSGLTTMAVSAGGVRVSNLTTVVFPGLDALGAEDVIEAAAAVGSGVGPGFDGLEHGAVGFVAHVPGGRVVEHLQAILQHLLLRHVGMLPGVQHAGSHVLKDRRGDVSGRVVEDVGEVVLGQQRVGGVGAVRVGPGLELVFARGINHAGRARLQRLGCGVDEGADEGGQQGHDEDGHRLGDLFHQRLEAWDFFDDRVQLPDHVVSELQDRVDLLDGLGRIDIRHGARFAGRGLGMIGRPGGALVLVTRKVLGQSASGAITPVGLAALVRGFLFVRATLEVLRLGDQVLGPRDLAQESRQRIERRAGRVRLSISEGDIHLVDLGLREVVGGLSQHGVEEVHHSERARHEGEDLVAVKVDLGPRTGVGEDIVEAHLAEGELAVVGVGGEILEGMETLAEATQRLTEVLLVSFAAGAMGVGPAVVDTAGQAVFDVRRTGGPVAALVGDVVFHAGVGVDIQFDLADGAAQSLVEHASVLVVGVVFGVAG